MQGKRQHGPFRIGMCSGCHAPHRSAAPKLLVQGPPDLCFSCHSEKGFVRGKVHKPVAEGRCFDCHSSHTSNYGFLLREEGDQACRVCHQAASEGFHPRTGFDRPEKLDAKQRVQQKLFGDKPYVLSHPAGGKDPKRPGRRFGCTSCHDPHSSDWAYAFRYEASKPSDLCLNCHGKGEKDKKGQKK
jgi:predicted CXXCH cytochrome family protein